MRIRSAIRSLVWIIAFTVVVGGWTYDHWTLMHRVDPVLISYPITEQKTETVCEIVQTVFGRLPEVQITIDEHHYALDVVARPSQQTAIARLIGQCEAQLRKRDKKETLSDSERGLQELYGTREVVRLYFH
jgi:hypothetical protein